MKKETLTAAEETLMREYYQTYLAIGQSCAPVDIYNAMEGITDAYKLVNRPRPEFVFVSSPLEAYKLIFESQNPGEKWSGQKEAPALWGCHEVFWIARHMFGLAIGIDYDEKDVRDLLIADRIAKANMWWWPFEEVCIVCDRPEHLKFDEQERLHCQDGPAIKFRDGASLYAWRDVTVPKQWIESPDDVDAAEVLNVENAEQRRAGGEIIGWDRLTDKLPNRIIDEDQDEYIGTLLSVDLPDAPDSRFLRMTCGTERVFMVPAAPDAKTALEANAAGNGWNGTGDPEKYIALIRT